MDHDATQSLVHTKIARRQALQIGVVGVLGLGLNHLQGLVQARESDSGPGFGRAKSCIFIFLSGGLAQHESFDLKPDAPDGVRGEFKPIATNTPGLQICEHLPLLAARSHLWAICRSLTHSSNDHSAGHHIMLTGRSTLPTGFDPNTNGRFDEPSIAAIVNRTFESRNNLPTAAILPERLVHYSGRIIPGQNAGKMGDNYDPWMIDASPFHTTCYGAYPEYSFDHQQRETPDNRLFQAPQLTLPQELPLGRVNGRLDLLAQLNRQRAAWDNAGSIHQFDRMRESAISLLTHERVFQALNVTKADDAKLDRYGRNSFGWSLLMARQLVETGVRLVQVNLGNDESWDTHGNAFPHLKDKLLPPTDRALSALLDDLSSSGQLHETLIVMASEFGRTPKISLLPQHYKLPGRDHWGAVQSVFFAGGGVQGGTVIGKSDRIGAVPADQPVTPEDFAATIYNALGIPRTDAWLDAEKRPHQIYYGTPIKGLV